MTTSSVIVEEAEKRQSNKKSRIGSIQTAIISTATWRETPSQRSHLPEPQLKLQHLSPPTTGSANSSSLSNCVTASLVDLNTLSSSSSSYVCTGPSSPSTPLTSRRRYHEPSILSAQEQGSMTPLPQPSKKSFLAKFWDIFRTTPPKTTTTACSSSAAMLTPTASTPSAAFCYFSESGTRLPVAEKTDRHLHSGLPLCKRDLGSAIASPSGSPFRVSGDLPTCKSDASTVICPGLTPSSCQTISPRELEDELPGTPLPSPCSSTALLLATTTTTHSDPSSSSSSSSSLAHFPDDGCYDVSSYENKYLRAAFRMPPSLDSLPGIPTSTSSPSSLEPDNSSCSSPSPSSFFSAGVSTCPATPRLDDATTTTNPRPSSISLHPPPHMSAHHRTLHAHPSSPCSPYITSPLNSLVASPFQQQVPQLPLCSARTLPTGGSHQQLSSSFSSSSYYVGAAATAERGGALSPAELPSAAYKKTTSQLCYPPPFEWQFVKEQIRRMVRVEDNMSLCGVPFHQWPLRKIPTLGASPSSCRVQEMYKADVSGIGGQTVRVFIKKIPVDVWSRQWEAEGRWNGEFVTDGENFVMEAAVLTYLQEYAPSIAPNLIAVLQLFRKRPSGRPEVSHVAIVSELYGEDLLDYIDRREKEGAQLKDVEKRELQYGAVRCLRRLHSLGLAHLDFTPENLLIGANGLRLCDFAKTTPLYTRHPRHVMAVDTHPNSGSSGKQHCSSYNSTCSIRHACGPLCVFESCEPTVGKGAYMPPECWKVYWKLEDTKVQYPLTELRPICCLQERKAYYFRVQEADTYMLGVLLFWIWADGGIWKCSDFTQDERYNHLVNSNLNFDLFRECRSWPQPIKDLLEKALAPAPSQRIKLEQLEAHRWWTFCFDEQPTRPSETRRAYRQS